MALALMKLTLGVYAAFSFRRVMLWVPMSIGASAPSSQVTLNVPLRTPAVWCLPQSYLLCICLSSAVRWSLRWMSLTLRKRGLCWLEVGWWCGPYSWFSEGLRFYFWLPFFTLFRFFLAWNLNSTPVFWVNLMRGLEFTSTGGNADLLNHLFLINFSWAGKLGADSYYFLGVLV